MRWLFGKKKPQPRNLSPMKTAGPIDFCCLTVTVSEKNQPEFGADYIIISETCYTWLFAYIEAIKSSTGKEIDLFGDADFNGAELEVVEAEFRKAIESLKLLPSQVPVQTLTQNNPDGTQVEHRRSLSASKLSSFLRVLLKMTRRAKAQGKFLYFRGQ